MKRVLQTMILALGGGAAIAFLVSFALGLRAPSSTTTRASDPVRIVPDVFSGRRVEVLNAAGITGLARNVTDMLRAAGYDVVYYGTLTRAMETRSVVVDRVGKPDLAQAVAARLNIGRVETRLDSTRLVEVSVILAADFRARDSVATQPVPATRR
jgi:hypothetical protein